MSGERVLSNAVDSNAMKLYSETIHSRVHFVSFDLYANGTTLSKNCVQSANKVRRRLVNVRGRSREWHEVGIAPVYQPGPSLSDQKQREEGSFLFHRFLFILLEEVIEASQRGKRIITGQNRIVLRLRAIVADQAQESNFFCLKAAGSYKDCSLRLMPSRESEMTGNAEGFDLDSEAEGNLHDTQTNPAAIILDRSVNDGLKAPYCGLRDVLSR